MSRTLDIKRDQASKATESHAKRRLLEDGVMFARFTIQQRTVAAEAAFSLWLTNGRPAILPEDITFLRKAIQQCLDSVRALDDDTIETIFSYEIHESEALLIKHVKGIGSPKASFALACAGIGRRGCIDVHAVKANYDKLEDLLSTAAKKDRTSRDWSEHRYRQACERLWDNEADTATAQWTEWLASPKSNPSGTDHECLR